MNEFNKTDEELKSMSDEELFEYLDAKAEYLKQHKKPLSPYKATRFAALGNAISNSDKGTDEVNKSFPDIQNIRKQSQKDGMDFFKKQQNEKQ